MVSVIFFISPYDGASINDELLIFKNILTLENKKKYSVLPNIFIKTERTLTNGMGTQVGTLHRSLQLHSR